MSRMSMLATGLLLLAALVGVYAVQDVVGVTLLVETWLTAVAGAVFVSGALFVLIRIAPEVIPRPGTARTKREWTAYCASVDRERAALAEAASRAAATLDAGLDGTRDGRLIDATGRFRTLGRFLPPSIDQGDHEVVDAELVDHEPVDSTRSSTTRDRGTAG